MKITLGFSPCPNDTFIFDALVNGKIDTEGFEFDAVLEDVQTLNEWALTGRLDVSKISYGVLPLVLEEYIVLSSGGALGKGVGPLLIAPQHIAPLLIPSCRIFVPGRNTTAHLLFSMAFPASLNKQFVRFDQVEELLLDSSTSVNSEPMNAGVIIHENRFTYQQKGLVKIMDLGEYWEQQTNAPIPLGGIVTRRSFTTTLQQQLDALVRKSVQYAFTNYPVITDYVKQHAREMDETVMRQHIDLYVNNYSIDLQEDGIAAVNKLMDLYEEVNEGKVFLVDQNNIFIERSHVL